MRRKLLVLFIFVLCTSLSLAVSDINVKVLKNQISLGEEASYEISITNKESSRQRYSIYSFQSGQGWDVNPSPLKDRIIELGSGQNYKTKIIARPTESFTPGIYRVQVTVESDLGERHEQTLKIYLGPEKPLDYLPAITVTTDMDEKINPRNPVGIKLFLENRNPLNLEDLVVKIQSDMPEFVQEAQVNLPPLEQKLVEFTVTPNKFQQPKDYLLYFIFERGGQTVKIVDQKITVLPLSPDFIVEASDKTSFFKTVTALSISNQGNILNEQEVIVPISFWQALFSSGGNIKNKEGQRYISWTLQLEPNVSKSEVYTTNYRIIFYVLILGLIFGLFYLYARSPVGVVKSAQTTHGDGSLSGIKITLEVKNKSTKPIKNVLVTDMVPGIANVEKSLELGTLKPHEVKHAKRGTHVVWSLAELDGLEHRLITYKVKAKLNILGTFSLPRATVQFKKGRRKRKAYSNVFRLES